MDERESYVQRLDRSMALLGRQLAAAMAQAGVSGPQYAVLRLIDESGTTNPSALAQTFCVSLSAITQLVKRLMRDGLVRRYEDESNRRFVILELTEHGRQSLAQTNIHRRQALRDLFAQLSPEEVGAFTTTLEKLVR